MQQVFLLSWSWMVKGTIRRQSKQASASYFTLQTIMRGHITRELERPHPRPKHETNSEFTSTIYVPTLTYSHKLWVVTERIGSPPPK